MSATSYWEWTNVNSCPGIGWCWLLSAIFLILAIVFLVLWLTKPTTTAQTMSVQDQTDAPPPAVVPPVNLGNAGSTFNALGATAVNSAGLTIVSGGNVGVSPGGTVTGFGGFPGT